ncbi:MAG: hypothetical protein JNL21_38910 [Myxococcales bacterium]|nr:hypothetical protein [Myxococcales bacterium]
MRGPYVIATIALGSLLFGCAKHSDSCKSSADPQAPFSELDLPTSEGNGRICEGSSKKIKVEHMGSDTGGWRDKYGTAIVAKGYAKKDCSGTQCIYTKGKARLRVNVIDAKKWTTVIVEDYPEK